MESSEILDKLPTHLKDLIIDQPYLEYTAQDQAVWRYVMNQNIYHLPKVAHPSYLSGLKKTGITIDSIPHMYGMNRILKEVGWAAAAVDGFIPPSAFMEFQAHHVLVIAADIRPIDQVGYTPAPDIIHEAAGHAPIIANKEYSNYLVRFGKTGNKAFSSKADYELYEAIRQLSILKAYPYSTPESLIAAEKLILAIEQSIQTSSELSLIRNLHWWTVEYGLIGDLKKPKIYGAGLLSSISESYNCLNDKVKKLHYGLDAAFTSFDITTQQPQLFVTPDFHHLTATLDAFSEQMAYKRGGLFALKKAIESGNISTCELNSGLQISGIFTNYFEKEGKPVYAQATGPAALAFQNKELENQGKKYHNDGFGFPIGKVKQFEQPLFRATKPEIESLTDKDGKIHLVFESGIELWGKPKEYTFREGKLLLISFYDCRIMFQGRVLFEPAWGIYDLATADQIVSAYPNPADPDAFEFHYPKVTTKTHKIVHTETAIKVQRLYSQVRKIRKSKSDFSELQGITNNLIENFPKEWLLFLEILELLNPDTQKEIYDQILEHLANLTNEELLRKLIDGGLNLLNNNRMKIRNQLF